MLKNSERVQDLKEKAVLKLKECSQIRKTKWDAKATEKTLQVGDLVLKKWYERKTITILGRTFPHNQGVQPSVISG